MFKGIPPGTYVVKVNIFHGYKADFYELFSIQIVDDNMYYNIFLFNIELQIKYFSYHVKCVNHANFMDLFLFFRLFHHYDINCVILKIA